MKMITISELNKDLVESISKIPSDIDLVVGIPRSGMLVATLISLYLNLPLGDIDSFINGDIYSVGHTKDKKKIKKISDIKKVLVVEDSVDSGKSITEAKNKLKHYDGEIIYLSAYVRTKTKNLVDIYFQVIDQSRVFEWNLFHHKILEHCCVDIDGVLCNDPTSIENDDGVNYKNFILNAQPKLIPTQTVGWLVSSRLEKYREETEIWLKKNNVKYNNLILLDGVTADERRKNGDHGEYKAKVYKSIPDSVLFIESDKVQAIEISRLSGKSVFCIENQKYYPSDFRGEVTERSLNIIKNVSRKVIPRNLRKKLKKFISM